MAMACKFRWAYFKGGVLTCLAAEFFEDACFMEAGVVTSHHMQDAGVGDNVT
jgi:hypothetical protein